MKYEHVPRPDIEQHYHIRELIERQEKRSNDRSYHQEQAKLKAERQDLIKDNDLVKVVDFWCHKCKKDFKGVAQKQEEVDWSNVNQTIAFYKTKCFKGHWCIRLITDKNQDPFWRQSRFVRKDRENHTLELLQPFEEGYHLLYGKQK